MPDVLVVGSLMLDTFLGSAHFEPPRPEAAHPQRLLECFRLGAKIELDTLVEAVGGGGINAATAIARLGIKPNLLGAVGRDDGRLALIKHCRNEGINWSVAVRSDQPTGRSYILLTRSAERTILVHHGASSDLNAHDVLTKLGSSMHLFFALHPNNKATTKTILQGATQRGIETCWLPGAADLEDKADFEQLSKLAALIVLNRSELSRVSGIAEEDFDKLTAYAQKLTTPRIVVTDGAKGALLVGQTGTFYAKADPVRAVDATGAGDGFAATFFARLLTTKDEREALRSAIINSASVVQAISGTRGLLRRIPSKSIMIKEV